MLQDNEMTDRAGIYLSEMLGTNKSLTKLSLAENKLTNRSAEHLTNSLQQNSTLLSLSLDNNQCISLYHLEQLASLLERNKQRHLSKQLLQLGHQRKDFHKQHPIQGAQ